MSKGSKKRPALISKEEEQLRWDYFQGKLNITEEEMKLHIAKIRQNKKEG